MENLRPKTIFCDIDGTLVPHLAPCITAQPHHKMRLLDGVYDEMMSWQSKGYTVILTSGRRESQRKETERQLSEVGIVYDQLILGITGGQRVLINDAKPKSTEPTAIALTLPRDKGFGELKL